jgi:2-polyprenyl-3-methyl-5-hydroxy-6-metoxy-1,4-benzoquinol methylase
MREYFDGLWGEVPEGLQPPYGLPRLAFLLGHLKAGERVLDLGCGEGWFTHELSAAGFPVVGVDVANEPLRRARERYPELDLRLIDVDRRWPLRDASFDAIWAGEVIEHVHHTGGWLSEARRVLRSGGKLLLSTPAHDRLTLLSLSLFPGAFAAHFDPRADHLRFYTKRSLRELLQDFRFEDVQIRGLGGLPGARALMLASARRAKF